MVAAGPLGNSEGQAEGEGEEGQGQRNSRVNRTRGRHLAFHPIVVLGLYLQQCSGATPGPELGVCFSRLSSRE